MRSKGALCACGAEDQRGSFCDVCGLPIVTAPRRDARKARRAGRRAPAEDGRPRRALPAMLVFVVLFGGTIGTAAFVARRFTADERAAAAKLRADVEAVLPELTRFVETSRGLTFARPVEVEVVDDEEFVARLRGGDRADGPAVRIPRAKRDSSSRGSTLEALGIVDEAGEFDEGVARLTDQVAGFYVPATDELLVRGTEVTVLTKVVLVHELVHALQDQRLGLGEADRGEPGSDEAAAFDALVEGDASRIEQAYYRSLTPGDAARVPSDQITGTVRGGKGAAAAFFGFSYASGVGFVRAIVDARGPAGLDAAYRDPPRSTEHVLHPERYLRGEQPVEVAAPEAGGAVLDSGVLGELGLVVALGGDADASVREAADGWNGDRYVTYSAGDRTCLRVRVEMDTPRDRDGLAAAFRARGATVTPVGPAGALVESCRAPAGGR